MTDRILNMEARLGNTAQAERGLDSLAVKASKVEEAAGGAAGGERSLAAALAARSEAASKALETTDKTFAATDRLAGIVGKVTSVVGLATLAIGAASAAWDYFTDAEAKAEAQTRAMNSALDGQIGKLKQTQIELKGVQEAAGRLASGGGLIEANLTATERREAQQRELDRLGVKEKLVKVLADEAAAELRVARARAAGGVSASEGELEALSAERERLAFNLQRLDLLDKQAQAAARGREGLGGGAGGGGGGGGRALGLADVNRIVDPFDLGAVLGGEAGGVDLGGGDIAGALAMVDDLMVSGEADAISFADGLAKVVGQLRTLEEQEKAVAEARKAGRTIALSYAEAAAKAGAAAALSAALRGESVAEAVNAVLQGVAVEATVEAAFETAKGVAAAANPLTAATAAGHFAAAKLFAATAALAGVGAVATGGFGGGGDGGGTSSPAQVSAPRGPGAFGRDRDEGGTVHNHYHMDLRSRPLATNHELARELRRVDNDYGRVPGAVRRGGG